MATSDDEDWNSASSDEVDTDAAVSSTEAVAVAKAKIEHYMRNTLPVWWEDYEGVPPSKEDALEIVGLLEQFPLLANEKYIASTHDFDETECFPLVYFVWNNYESIILDRIYSLNTKAVTQDLLEDFCSKGGPSDETLIWLVPKCNMDRCDISKPFDTLLLKRHSGSTSHPLSFKVFKAFFENNNIIIEDQDLVTKLLALDYEPGILCFVLSKVQVKNRRLVLDDYFYGWEQIEWKMNSAKAKIVAEILPALKVLHCRTLYWDELYCLSSLLAVVENCRMLRVLTLDISSYLIETHPKVFEAVLHILKNQTKCPMKLSITIVSDAGAYDDELYDCLLLRGFSEEQFNDFEQEVEELCLRRLLETFRSVQGQGPIIHELELHLGSFGLEVSDVCEFGKFVNTLSLGHVALKGDCHHLCELWNLNCARTPSFKCSTRKAWRIISNIPRHDHFYIEAGHQPLQRLVSLTLRNHRDEIDSDITPAAVALLSLQTLECLTLDIRFKIQLPILCEELMENTSLRWLELNCLSFIVSKSDQTVASMFLRVVEERNTILSTLLLRDEKQCHFVSNTDHPGLDDDGAKSFEFDICTKKIRYSLLMNQLGRGKLREKTATLRDAVAVISNVMHITKTVSASVSAVAQDELDRASLLYGLLREKPALWCLGPSPGKNKRKHSSS